MILYTADLHLGHVNIIRMDHRPFSDADEMDEYLIAKWNDRVQNDDEVYMLGDFCYRSGKDPVQYLRRMKGRKHLVVGNHDTKLINNKPAMAYFDTVKNSMQITLCRYHPVLFLSQI